MTRLILIGIVCGWIARVWTKEEITADIQRAIALGIDTTRLRFEAATEQRRWPRAVGLWLQGKFLYGWHCPTCFGHYPAALLVATMGRPLLHDSYAGYVVAWLFTGLVSDTTVHLIACLRKTRDVLHHHSGVH